MPERHQYLIDKMRGWQPNKTEAEILQMLGAMSSYQASRRRTYRRCGLALQPFPADQRSCCPRPEVISTALARKARNSPRVAVGIPGSTIEAHSRRTDSLKASCGDYALPQRSRLTVTTSSRGSRWCGLRARSCCRRHPSLEPRAASARAHLRPACRLRERRPSAGARKASQVLSPRRGFLFLPPLTLAGAGDGMV